MTDDVRGEPAEPVYRDIPPTMSEPMYDVYMPVTGVIGDPVVAARNVSGWCAPSEAERWQWLTDDERAAELAEAREDATRHGHEVIMVGGMILPHTPAPPSDGMWPLPTVSINVDTEEFRARMAEARERIGDLAAGLAAAFDAVNGGLGPALAALGRALDDRDPTPPITDVETALIALDYAERTQVVHHPDKRTRRHAKARYLEVRRHLPREYRRRLKSVPVNQFGSLT